MSNKEETQERILRAFLALAVEHGYEGTTTRAVAEAAGVNEVTLFRHFGDKERLAREAFTRLGPEQQLAQYEVHFDSTDPEHVEAGLRGCLIFLRNTLRESPVMFNPGLRDVWHRNGCDEQTRAGVPRAALALLQRALAVARPVLRPEVDQDAAAFSLVAVVLMSVLWQRFERSTFCDADNDRLLVATLRPLINWEAHADTAIERDHRNHAHGDTIQVRCS